MPVKALTDTHVPCHKQIIFPGQKCQEIGLENSLLYVTLTVLDSITSAITGISAHIQQLQGYSAVELSKRL